MEPPILCARATYCEAELSAPGLELESANMVCEWLPPPWLCAASSAVTSICFSAPIEAPSVRVTEPETVSVYVPDPIGVLPIEFGKLKVVVPLPAP